ncbi:MAG: PAS domain S-box protein, partial [Moraxellaceae bacterium]
MICRIYRVFMTSSRASVNSGGFMFNFFKSSAKDNGCHEKAQIVSALYQAQAVIEFEPNGTILHANDLFLSTVGYSLMEIQGRHHSMFLDSEQKNSHEYSRFWARLAAGESQQAVFKRLDKHGKIIWLQASYSPLFDEQGRVYKVIKFAQDIRKYYYRKQSSKRSDTLLTESLVAEIPTLEMEHHWVTTEDGNTIMLAT